MGDPYSALCLGGCERQAPYPPPPLSDAQWRRRDYVLPSGALAMSGVCCHACRTDPTSTNGKGVHVYDDGGEWIDDRPEDKTMRQTI